jgi:alpha-galactosidase
MGAEDGQRILRFTAAEDGLAGEGALRLFDTTLRELCELAGVGAEARGRFGDRAERRVFANGWQSWCFGGELAAGERVRRARIVPNINVYTDGPGPREARGEILSRFITYLRSGEDWLVLASVGSPERATPPVTFRIDRGSLDIRGEAAAKGGRFAKGELLAELRLFHRAGWFEVRDALRDAYRGFGHFDRLGFLGPVPGGYESWYNHYTHIDAGIIERDLASIGTNDNLINAYYLRRGKPTVFQIDDGWEMSVGQWEADESKFPEGMGVFAEGIEARGMVPGIWIAPLLATRASAVFREKPRWILRNSLGKPVPAGFNPGWDGVFFCLDISLPEVEDYLAELFDTIIEDWGYRYLKLDFLYAGFIEGARKRPGAAYEHYDRLMRRLCSRTTDSRGRAVAYLGCGAPFEPSFRHFPLMRIGADTKERWEDPLLKHLVRHQGRPAAYTNLTHTIGRSLLDGAVFVNDPDVVFCRTSRMSLTETEKELVALVDFMLASQLMFSDDAHDFGAPDEAAFTARMVDLFDRLEGRDYGAQRVAKDVYSIFSRDGLVRGIANLSNRPWKAPSHDPERAIVIHATSEGGSLAFEPHSISLFEERGQR